MEDNKEISDVLLVSYDKANGDRPILLVARRGSKGETVIISGFTDNKATDIYNKLIEGGEL